MDGQTDGVRHLMLPSREGGSHNNEVNVLEVGQTY